MKRLERLVDRVIDTDLLIIGSEGAGARAAIEAARAGIKVTIATKGPVGKSGATVTGDADVDLDSRSAIELLGLKGDPADSPEAFFEDMVVESKYISNQKLVEIHVREAAARVKDLADFGAKITEIIHNPGHSYPRGVWLPGPRFVSALKKELSKYPVDRLEYMMIVELLKAEGQVAGALGVKLDSGELYLIGARATLICCGGGLRLYPHTTAPDDLTGDGQAMAYRAGAEMIDMEFPMFLPYTLINPPAMDGVDYPFLIINRMEAHALNRRGQRYMGRWDPVRMERSTRDICSIGIAMEVLEGKGSRSGGVYVSLSHLPEELVEDAARWFPPEISGWRYGGFKIKDFIPDFKDKGFEVGPACHFQNGGIRINERCKTTVPGLYAAGEGTGSIMGANRISGNALTMTQVWGARAGRYAAEFARKNRRVSIDPGGVKELKECITAPFRRGRGNDVVALRKEMQKLAGDRIGVIRDEEGLEEALREQERLLGRELPHAALSHKGRVFNREWLEYLQLPNMLQVLEMTARASLMRTESRGALYRRDYPKTNNNRWLKNIVIKQEDGGMALREEAAVITKLRPPRGVFDYGFIPRPKRKKE